MTIDEVKSYYGSFDCEVLTSNPQNEMKIRDFTCHIRNNTLENYLKTDAWKEDIDGETRVYLIREHNTRQIVLFFSLKCGTLFTTYKLDDSYNELEEAQKSLVDEMVNLRLNHNDDQFYQMFKQIQTVFDKKQSGIMLNIVEHRVNLKREREALQETNSVLRVERCYSAIEIRHLCRCDSFDARSLTGFPLGFGLFWCKIVPLILNIAKMVGCEYLYVFAADRSDDSDASKLITYYKQSLCFRSLDSDGVAVLKPGYDENCKGLIQTVKYLPEMEKDIWEMFSDHAVEG